ncbi:MAG: hypothetical protein E7488_03625 [Ruminococcaceae bacterium]|nr:hypothetical protein [Oscillospiraceae bacterium]
MGKDKGFFDNLFDWNSDGKLDFWESAIDTHVYLPAHKHGWDSVRTNTYDEYDEFDELDEFDEFGDYYDE